MGGLRRWGLEGTGDASLAIEIFRDWEEGSGEPAGEVLEPLLRISRGAEDIGGCLQASTLLRRLLSLLNDLGRLYHRERKSFVKDVMSMGWARQKEREEHVGVPLLSFSQGTNSTRASTSATQAQ
jgi:hypothetical protein